MSDKENSASKKSRFRMARGWVAFACVAFALAGMAFRVGIGTPSAFGIQQISAICPLGRPRDHGGRKRRHAASAIAVCVGRGVDCPGRQGILRLDVPCSVAAEVLPPEKA